MRQFLTSEYSSCMLIGGQGSGKTHFTKNYIRHCHKSYTKVLILTGTMFNEEYNDLMELDNIIIQEFSIVGLTDLVNFQIESKKNKKNISWLVVLDDFVSVFDELKKTDRSVFTKLASLSRHLNMSVIYLVQRCSGIIPTSLRQNIYNYVLFQGLPHGELRCMHDMMSSCVFTTSETFYFRYHDWYMTNHRRGFCIVRRNGQTKKPILFYEDNCIIENRLILNGEHAPITQQEFDRRFTGRNVDESIKYIQGLINQKYKSKK